MDDRLTVSENKLKLTIADVKRALLETGAGEGQFVFAQPGMSYENRGASSPSLAYVVDEGNVFVHRTNYAGGEVAPTAADIVQFGETSLMSLEDFVRAEASGRAQAVGESLTADGACDSLLSEIRASLGKPMIVGAAKESVEPAAANAADKDIIEAIKTKGLAAGEELMVVADAAPTQVSNDAMIVYGLSVSAEGSLITNRYVLDTSRGNKEIAGPFNDKASNEGVIAWGFSGEVAERSLYEHKGFAGDKPEESLALIDAVKASNLKINGGVVSEIKAAEQEQPAPATDTPTTKKPLVDGLRDFVGGHGVNVLIGGAALFAGGKIVQAFMGEENEFSKWIAPVAGIIGAITGGMDNTITAKAGDFVKAFTKSFFDKESGIDGFGDKLRAAWETAVGAFKGNQATVAGV